MSVCFILGRQKNLAGFRKRLYDVCMSIANQTIAMRKKAAPQDWHKADIRAAVHRLGLTFKGLALAHGYRSVDAVSQALHRPYPKVERIIGEAIGVPPEVIWPSRYTLKHSRGAAAHPVKTHREV